MARGKTIIQGGRVWRQSVGLGQPFIRESTSALVAASPNPPIREKHQHPSLPDEPHSSSPSHTSSADGTSFSMAQLLQSLKKAGIYGGVSRFGNSAAATVEFMQKKHPLLKIPFEHAARTVARPVSREFVAGEDIESGVQKMALMVQNGKIPIADYAEFEFKGDQEPKVYDNVVIKSCELIDKLCNTFNHSGSNRIPVDLALKVISHGKVSIAQTVQERLLSFGKGCVLTKEQSKAFLSTLTPDERQDYMALYERVKTVTSHAKGKCCIVVDKEQNRFNRFIDFVTAELIREGHIDAVMLTVQGGYADTEAEIKPLLDIAHLCKESEVFCAAKVVGCAYIEEERAYAKEHNLDDPTACDENTTHENYRKHFEKLYLSGLFDELVVASHRGENVIFAYNLTQSHPSTTTVYRATLMGMDHRGLPDNHPARSLPEKKYAPISKDPLDPYLMRRLIENAGLTALAEFYRHVTNVVHMTSEGLAMLCDSLGLTSHSTYDQR